MWVLYSYSSYQFLSGLRGSVEVNKCPVDPHPSTWNRFRCVRLLYCWLLTATFNWFGTLKVVSRLDCAMPSADDTASVMNTVVLPKNGGTQRGLLDATTLPRILDITSFKPRANLAQKGYWEPGDNENKCAFKCFLTLMLRTRWIRYDRG